MSPNEKLARAFHLQPYQLLIEGLDPANPLIARLTPNEARFYSRLQADIQRLQETMAEYNTRTEPK